MAKLESKKKTVLIAIAPHVWSLVDIVLINIIFASTLLVSFEPLNRKQLKRK